jgi:hypothetical protein
MVFRDIDSTCIVTNDGDSLITNKLNILDIVLLSTTLEYSKMSQLYIRLQL